MLTGCSRSVLARRGLFRGGRRAPAARIRSLRPCSAVTEGAVVDPSISTTGLSHGDAAEEFTEETVSCSVVVRQGVGRQAYRFGMDALILATDLPPESVFPGATVCELGAANGVVALSVAARYPDAEVYAVERQRSLYHLLVDNTTRNVLRAPRLRPVLADVRHLPTDPAAVPLNSASLVLCNPPFFEHTPEVTRGNPLRETERAATRHELHGGLRHFLAAARAIAAPLGFAKFVLPPKRLPELLALAYGGGGMGGGGGDDDGGGGPAPPVRREEALHLHSLRFLHPGPGEPAYLFEAVLRKGRPPPSGVAVRPPLSLRDARSGEWTDEMSERVAFAALPPPGSAYREPALDALLEVEVYRGAVERLRSGQAVLDWGGGAAGAGEAPGALRGGGRQQQRRAEEDAAERAALPEHHSLEPGGGGEQHHLDDATAAATAGGAFRTAEWGRVDN